MPFAPGTAGTLGGVLVWFLTKGHVLWHASALVLLFCLGIWSGRAAIKELKDSDPPSVVIDEAAGLLAASFLLPFTIWTAVGVFIIFRIFDIIKPPPVRQLERLGGAWGIMADDIMAGVYTNIVMQICIRIF